MEKKQLTIFNHIYEAIKSHKRIIIHRHSNPDPDAIGSQKGLALLIQSGFPDKEVYCVGAPFFLLNDVAPMDTIPDTYYNEALVIVVDTANRPRIDDARYATGKTLIKIDHHPVVDTYGDIAYEDPSASSVSEIIVQFAQVFAETLPMTDLAAQLLYAGIVGDTGRFLYESTTSRTLDAAKYLRQFNFNPTTVNYLLIEKPSSVIQLLGYAMANVVVSANGVAHVIIYQEQLKKFHLSDEDTAALISFPGEIKDVICWGLFVEQPSGAFRARLRSKGPTINDIAEEFRGGGHRLASGAHASDLADIGMILARFEERASDWRHQQ